MMRELLSKLLSYFTHNTEVTSSTFGQVYARNLQILKHFKLGRFMAIHAHHHKDTEFIVILVILIVGFCDKVQTKVKKRMFKRH